MKQFLNRIVKSNTLLFLISKKILRIKRKFRKPISGKNNVIINKGVSYKVKYDIVGNRNLIQINKGVSLSNMLIFIRGDNHKLIIDENCLYKSGCIWFEDNNCQIIIGCNTSIESANLAAIEPNRKILIGEDCMFSHDIEFRTGDSHSILEKDTKRRINFARDIIIGDHVWIGAHSKILKGVTVGNNSIIGINSLVTKSIPEHSLAAGIPARVIKANIDWSRERIYY